MRTTIVSRSDVLDESYFDMRGDGVLQEVNMGYSLSGSSRRSITTYLFANITTMQILKAFVGLLTLLIFTPGSSAQCSGCIPDLSCTVSPAFPTLCPMEAPVATQGENYEADFTFWMPATFSDPNSGISVDFEQMTVTGVSGIPLGMTFEASEPGGVYFPQQNEFGCARICGTPVIPGIHQVIIDILATVAISGFTTQVPEQFILTLTVLPGSGSNNSFSFAPSSGCGSVTVAFEALIDGTPSPTSYAWDFGNGNTSDQQQPPPQTYDTPGQHVVSLATTIGGHQLNSVMITGVNDNWCGDVEEPNIPLAGCSGSPDIYFVLTDGNGATLTSSTFDNTFNATWTDLGHLLAAPPYSISIYDEDPISQDDLLGTYNIPLDGPGTYFFNVAGGTSGSLDITLEDVQAFFDTDTVMVFAEPQVEIIEQSEELCASDPDLLGHIWVLNGDTIATNTPCIPVENSGSYTLIAFNSAGCGSISEPFTVCPVLHIELTGSVLHVPSGYVSYAWTLNGAPIGGNDPFLVVSGDGTYEVTVDAGDGCTITAAMGILVGMGELDHQAGMMIFPNPNNGAFTLTAAGVAGNKGMVQVLDAMGRMVHAEQVTIVNGNIHEVMALNLAPGAYQVRLVTPEGMAVQRISIRK